MSSKKDMGIKLLKRGCSYKEISSKLDVAKSTINSWFSSLSKEDKEQIRKIRIQNWRKSIRDYQEKRCRRILSQESQIQKQAARSIEKLSQRELLLIGTGLYWAEGTKTDRWHLQFSNSDPEMIRLIMSFFRRACKVQENKFYMQMILHENIEENKAKNYWSKITGVPKKQFKKACYSLSKGSKKKRRKNKLPFGTLQVRIMDKELTHQVYGYIRLVPK